MGGIGGMELLIVGLVALIVVGPKDLPGMFRTVGQFTGKAKRMAREFSNAMEAAADDAGVSDVTKTLNKTMNAAANPVKAATTAATDAVKSTIDPEKYEEGSATKELSKERADAAEKIKAQYAKVAKEKADAKTADATAVEAGASDAKPAEAKPAGAKPADPKPAPEPAADMPDTGTKKATK